MHRPMGPRNINDMNYLTSWAYVQTTSERGLGFKARVTRHLAHDQITQPRVPGGVPGVNGFDDPELMTAFRVIVTSVLVSTPTRNYW